MAHEAPNSRLRSRSRSLSPRPSPPPTNRPHRHRSTSPREQRDHREHRHHRHHHHSHHKRRRLSSPPDTTSLIPPSAVPPRPLILSYNAKPLGKHDLAKYRPLFASYLDIQKSLVLEDLPADEAKGRWKSFVGRWNKGELAAGWYDAATLEKAVTMATEEERYREEAREEEEPAAEEVPQTGGATDDAEADSEDELGPAPPPANTRGPGVPTRGDLTLRDEALSEASAASRVELKAQRKADRVLQKERLDELAPRAEAGTAERQREKRREKADGHARFAEARGGGDGVAELGEGEVMGGSEDVREMKMREERKKNERELRREEVLRARQAEREEKLSGMREREEKTLAMLKALAKERFG